MLGEYCKDHDYYRDIIANDSSIPMQLMFRVILSFAITFIKSKNCTRNFKKHTYNLIKHQMFTESSQEFNLLKTTSLRLKFHKHKKVPMLSYIFHQNGQTPLNGSTTTLETPKAMRANIST